MAKKPHQTSNGKPVNNVVVISDTHSGCRLALCPKGPIKLLDGGTYRASRLQRKIGAMWDFFWREWVPMATHGEPYAVVFNGDAIDGDHHQSTGQISHNLLDQRRISVALLKPIAEACEGRFYALRGTEAHGGKSGVDEETIAQELGAIPDIDGNHARWELWLAIGRGLVHFGHHIGTTGSVAYESTAPMKELIEAYTEAGKTRLRPPDVVVRSHRHRHSEVRIPTKLGYGISFTTAGWQLKTPIVWRSASGRNASPQIGGSLIRQGDNDLFTRHKVWNLARPKVERIPNG